MIDLMPAPVEPANKEDLLIDIRALVAKHLGVGVEYIAYNSHFSDDLGLDWLDVVELIVLVEDQFPDLKIVEDVEMASLDELIQHIQFVAEEEIIVQPVG
jgi:acyl carrier protein